VEFYYFAKSAPGGLWGAKGAILQNSINCNILPSLAPNKKSYTLCQTYNRGLPNLDFFKFCKVPLGSSEAPGTQIRENLEFATFRLDWPLAM
jgi:hypothetical protein